MSAGPWRRQIGRLEISEADRRALGWRFTGTNEMAMLKTVVGFVYRNGVDGLDDVRVEYENWLEEGRMRRERAGGN